MKVEWKEPIKELAEFHAYEKLIEQLEALDSKYFSLILDVFTFRLQIHTDSAFVGGVGELKAIWKIICELCDHSTTEIGFDFGIDYTPKAEYEDGELLPIFPELIFSLYNHQTEDKFDFDDYYGGHYEESLVNGLATLADLLEKFVLTLNQRIPSRKMKYEELVKKSNPDL